MKFPPSKFLRSKLGLAAIAALLLILFLWRPGVYRLRNRIATTIGSALGRKVALDNVSLRFLPRPGFDLEGLVIYDDPAFSAEPMIRAQEVSAAIRLRSLLRGRLEIANLSASEPSINLVRNREGRWNLASLIERNAQIPAAPTGKAASERRPAFPYLEASNARINFKIGQTKKSYALIDADVALWQDSENSWGARLKAEPVRTDFNLTDTGLLQINATWQRAASLQSTPIQITGQWRNGQLGQITKLLSGKDRGWRGGVNFTARVYGTPEELRIESRTAIDDLHRYDIAPSENMRLTADCSGRYNGPSRTIDDLVCGSPVSGGFLRLRGKVALAAPTPTYDLTLDAEKVPLTSAVRFLRQAKAETPGNLTASGLLNGEFRTTRSAPYTAVQSTMQRAAQTWTGSGSAMDVRLSANGGKDEVTIGTIPLSLVGVDSEDVSPRRRRGRPKVRELDREPAEPHLRIGPVALVMSASAPVSAGGWISASGYRVFVRGDMELKDLFRLENLLALPVARPAAEGLAKLDVNVSGPWQGLAPVVTSGTAQLRNVRAEMRGLNTPIEIRAATVSLTPDAVFMQEISARTGSTQWSGSVRAPRHCVAADAAPSCGFQFDLTAGEISTGDLAEWFTPHPAKRPWYGILNSSEAPGASPLLAIQARGTLHVGRFDLKKMVATQVATEVEVDRGKITLTGLRAQLLQGSLKGNWTIDASSHDVPARPVRHQGAGMFQDISLAQLATSMDNAWIAGTADGKFDVEASGNSFGEMMASSDGKLKFAMRNGNLPHVEVPGLPVPLPVHRFTGELRLKKGAWELSGGRLESRDGIYQVKGTAAPGGILDFVLTRGDEQSWMVTGTLAEPRVEPAGHTKLTETTAKTVKP